MGQEEAGDDDGENVKTDLRSEWLKTRVLTTLKVKAEKWAEMDEESLFPIKDFLDTGTQCLFITLGERDKICASVSAPSGARKKSCFFLKLEEEKLKTDPEEFNKQFISGDFSKSPLEQLLPLAQDIYLPILMDLWEEDVVPEVIVQDVKEKAAGFLACLTRVIGLSKGQTVLPAPMTVDAQNDTVLQDPGARKEALYALESSIITWTEQIEAVLRTEPDNILDQNERAGALKQLEFWEAKAKNLGYILEQLEATKLKTIVELLGKARSTYLPAFERLCVDLRAAHEEASQNVPYLKTIEAELHAMGSSDDFSQVRMLYKPILHGLLLICKTSSFFNTPTRVLCLLRMLHNDFINQCRKFCDSSSVFEGETPLEALARINQVVGERVGVGLRVQNQFYEYKQKAEDEMGEDHPWELPATLLFSRLDRFLERCKDVRSLLHTIMQFQRLERIEIGGTKGDMLSESVLHLYALFQQEVKIFATITYDCFDINDDSFDRDYDKFAKWISEADIQIGSVVAQGLADCVSVEAAFKLLSSFEGVIERPAIQNILERNYLSLLLEYDKDLKKILHLFVKHQHAPPIYNNMPPVSGALHWTLGLESRAEHPMMQFQDLCKGPLLESDEMKETTETYNHLIESLHTYNTEKQAEWAKDVDDTVVSKLQLPLLRRDDDELGTMHVNFDQMLVRLLREVGYLLKLRLQVPDTAMSIFKKSEVYRTQTGNLELIMNKYNWIQANLLDVERPLVQAELDAAVAILDKGVNQLNWNDYGITEFVQEASSVVVGVENVLKTLKTNVDKIQGLLQVYIPALLQRSDSRVYYPEEIQEQFEDAASDRKDAFIESGQQVHDVVVSSLKICKMVKTNAAWKEYISYLNGVVVGSLMTNILSSLSSVSNSISTEVMKQTDASPMLFVTLDLEMDDAGGDVLFTPDINNDRKRVNVRHMIVGWMKEFHTMFNGMKRLCTGNGHYLVEIEEQSELRVQVEQIVTLLDANEAACEDFRKKFTQYSDLWTKEISTSFREWWDEVAVAAVEERATVEEVVDGEPAAETEEAAAEDDDVVEVAKFPPLSEFESKIDTYSNMRDDVSALPTNVDVGWLRVDCKPVRQQVLYWADQWVQQWTEFLLQNITESMQQMSDFIYDSTATLQLEVAPNDEMGLRKVLEAVRDVKKNTKKYDNLVGPLKQQAAILKKFGVQVGDITVEQMDSAPDQWDSVKNRMFETKERLSDLYVREGEKIKSRAFAFVKEVATYRTKFQADAPFEYSIGPAASYERLEEEYGSIREYRNQVASLRDLQELFELPQGDYKEIASCSKEMSLLKSVWDVAQLVGNAFHDWRTTLWDNIDTEYYMDEAKKLKDIVKKVDKRVRIWDVYKGVEGEIANMMVALPLIQMLKSDSMRPRHWKELMMVTGKSFTMDSNFCLADLIALQLHQFEEDVESVVIKSQKELTIEKNMSKIKEIWDKMVIEYSVYPKDDTVYMMKVVEELVEAREEHQVSLQAMQASKYIKVFEEQVNTWLKKLGQVEAVCQVWATVQDKWMQLESIFIGSEDIRAQLPDDSKRFDTIDEDWRSIMSESVEIPSALEVCNRENQLEKLEKMEEGLDLCQKALDEYLGTKRTAFPRFYFVAPADLLDILSKGSNPLLIQPHFSKCFDNIGKLEFDKAEVETGRAYHAHGMYSSENEYVPFHTTFSAKDQAVESYLQALVHHQQDCLRSSLQEGLSTYTPDSRHKWLFNYCCQIVLVATMIWWTTEVNQAFAALEDGMDTALKDQWQNQVDQLKNLTMLVRGKLNKLDRRKIVTLMTIDVHARDVVAKLIAKKVDNSQCFEWLSQLRVAWDDEKSMCYCDNCDARFVYGYEYVGNCGRLVITPLTDRCYITLTQALRLKMGGAPAGPAGTGKTETTKDLARALGIICYVFNCSPQMNSGVMANIFKGLAASGSWGCFDEFNRIAIETLSVIATQFRCVLVGIRTLGMLPAQHVVVGHFNFDGEECALVPTCMGFITMNPGYAGRTALPENVKALFRAVAMIVPDMEMICEIMLFSEGFGDARNLARKFMLLFRLNKDLLSVQVHYDWGLRAVKSILVIAGGLKRADPDIEEDGVLMRALRDCNLPKLVLDDVDVFLGTVSDIFPGIELPRRRDPPFEELLRAACSDLKLQAEEIFIAKISALRELYEVRHSVFILGPAASGKSMVWRVLADAQCRNDQKTVYEVINPKAQDTNELYGFIHPVVGWKDGVFSFVMRNFAQMENQWWKWIVFDGDVDPDWIESLNTVMDDNKTLTLASNERVPLNPTMRLLIEVDNLRNASPATVSRGGVLMLNERDLGWKPFVESWVQARANSRERDMLQMCFNDYFDQTIEYCRRNIHSITPVMEINQVMTVCWLLNALLVDDPRIEVTKEVIEIRFVYASVWGFGGPLSVDKGVDYRKQFSEWWKLTFQVVPFGDNHVYDYRIDEDTNAFVPWDSVVPGYHHSVEVPFYNITVPTADSVRLTRLMTMLTEQKRHVQFCGLAGTAKSTIVREKVRSLPEDWSSCTLYMNSKTDAFNLQLTIETYLEKRAGKTFTPIGNKKHIYFLDDLNMPGYDKWSTQTPIELLVQLVDHAFLFDRFKIGVLKEIKNAQFISAMNPTAGSFTINPRLQRQFSCFACNLPSDESIETIYHSILKGMLTGFDQTVVNMVGSVVNATITLHNIMLKQFLPNAIKFHYTWNLRELSNIFQGLSSATPTHFMIPDNFARLWCHEVSRVYGDRLMTTADIELFGSKCEEVVVKCLDNIDRDKVLELPNMFCTFCAGEDSDLYLPITDQAKLRTVLDEKMVEYNEVNAKMDLVLFEMFAEHATRISRILNKPRGNGMIVGVGGSGKQSLTKLTAFLSDMSIFSIQLTASYNVGNLKEDMLALYKKAGVKGESVVWMLTDAQIVDDTFLVYVNDFLSSGNLPDLFDAETKGDIINAVRNEVKAEGIIDTNDNCWEYFIDKVRRLLHVMFCMSPVGDKMRTWCRKFPALINCSVIDWVHSWPEEALKSVAIRFIAAIDFGKDETLMPRIADYMSFVHMKTVEMCTNYLQVERRYNYATPKSYLEFIALYKLLLDKKRGEIESEFNSLETGLQKLKQTEEDVGQLQIRLKEEAVYVKEKTESTEKLLVTVAAETEIVNENRARADRENAKASVEREVATKVQSECDVELAKAEPLVKQALGALDTLNKEAIQELKGFNNPPAGVAEVLECVLYMTSPEGKLCKDASFRAAKKEMNDPGKFVAHLKAMDINNIPRANVTKVKVSFEKNGIKEGGANDPDIVKGRSSAAGGLASWVVNIVMYDDCLQMITPLRTNLNEAKKNLANAEATVKAVTEEVAELEAKLKILTDEFEGATTEKNVLVENAALTEKKLTMAQRLVNGLADEKVRWAESITTMKARAVAMIGDTLLSSAFVSYIGAFGAEFRATLTNDVWIPDMRAKDIPSSDEMNPLNVLCDISDRAVWANQGLPADLLSVENGSIVSNCARWPLLIDPQLQGVTWIKKREANNDLKVLTQSGKFLDSVERAISMGNSLIIENLPDFVEPVLEPVLARSTVKRGGMVFIKLGDKDDVEYDFNFKLFLQTKLQNPHYAPEVAAQTTLINFTVTEKGLEDQLLAVVVQYERPDLEERLQDLVRESNEFTKTLKDLADGLLYKLSNAQGNLIEDIELIENLEQTKLTAIEVAGAQVEGKIAEKEIAVSREVYRPAAARASLVYFVLNQLWIIDHMYQYSLGGFMRVFKKSIEFAEKSPDVKQRVLNVTDNITYTLFGYASRGLFARHKLMFSSQLCFRIMRQNNELNQIAFEFLLRLPKQRTEKPPELEWLSDGCWWAINALAKLEGLENIANDVLSSSKRFKEWCDLEASEKEKLPLEYKSLPPLERMCLVRALRPDRMTMATEDFIEDYMGKRYVDDVSASLENVLKESDPATPVYYILTPGVDVVGEVEKAGKARGMTAEEGKFSDVSLGEGKDVISDREVDRLTKDGGWVILQNVHLMPRWLVELEKRIERNAPDAHPDFRLFLTSDPSKTIPVALLQRCLKLTQEPPPGMKALYKRSWSSFDDLTWDASSKQQEMKKTLFCLTFFHACVIERKKFGPQGWNRVYPFSLGDLTACKDVLFNYLESSGISVPWEDLKYIFGEIMYGGHITDGFDRLLCATYLDKLMRNELLEGLEFYPGFSGAPDSSHTRMMEHIEENMGTESPIMFGLHPNAEIGFRLDQSDTLYSVVADLQPRSASGGGGASMQERVSLLMEDIQERLAEGLVDTEELMARIEAEEGRTPFINVFYQECKYMNTLVGEIQKSLEVLRLGLSGELQMSDAMETLMNSLFDGKVPATWEKVAFVSMRPLSGWMDNLVQRIKQLQDWTIDLSMPRAVWVSGFFNPQSFLTAILQTQARKNEWALDQVVVSTEVTKKTKEEVEAASKEGSFIWGLSMEGARWDGGGGTVNQSLPKEMFCEMPVMLARAIPVDKAEYKDTFMCPVYKVQQRGHTFVFQANLKTRVDHTTWIIAGVAMLMDVVL